MKINKINLIIISVIFSFIVVKTIQKRSLNQASEALIQKSIEPDLLKNSSIDSFQKNETINQYKNG